MKEFKSVRNTDIVVWLTFGMTHLPFVEESPVTPVEIFGFSIKLMNFILQYPSIDIHPSKKKAAARK
ncbi:copper amine oxidase [Phascolomyces articulosus]|uniref:Amine oxidase n=1 Tax=Phascolomyces articulosus TaxID=60185 RepID=A0AAD5KC29_9FUNG|nr:copper amine oxidase [Phascolomyces articulosus]